MAKKYVQEIEQGYTPRTVMEEASRCLLCYDAPCSKSCPAGTDPGKFIRSVRFRNFKGAAETIRENNALGAICARVCPTERYCQEACSRCGIDRPIDIGKIQRFVTDFEDATGMEILQKGKSNGKSVAIVGSGPSALQAAASLLRAGFAVDIYEKNAKAGGYLRYGIPEYRLPSEILDKEIERIKKLGARIHVNVKVGKDISVAALENNHDAVILAIGASDAKILPMFADNHYVETAVSFLARAKDSKGEIVVEDNILVVGGGDVAMDVDTTLKLLGVKNVTDVVYEEFSEFRASKKELEGAQKLGVSIIDGYVPTAVNDNEVVFHHRHLESELRIKADKIILAVGQVVNADGMNINIVHNEIDSDGYRTEDPKLFVTGDIAHGDKTVVYAVRKGKEVAYVVANSIGGAK
jgi:dihydropyrimidine dehydrogenase (NAD+) subunit PreT